VRRWRTDGSKFESQELSNALIKMCAVGAQTGANMKKDENLKKSRRPVIITIAVLWATISIAAYTIQGPTFSQSERRVLAKLPQFSLKDLWSGKFEEDLDDYTLDHFPYRDFMRTVKSLSAYYLYGKLDNNGIYLSNGHAASLEYPQNDNSIRFATEKLRRIYEDYLIGTDVNVFLSIIPDKGYFLADENGYLSLDYEAFFDLVREYTDFAEYIDISGLLEITDYYKTDSHWSQDKIGLVANAILSGMCGGKTGEFDTVTANVAFYGVYYGQSALPLAPDAIHYLTNETLSACTVYNVETNETTGIYNTDKLTGRDPYDVFLSGASAVLIIDSPLAKTEKELVIFRDSFASSLTPLLCENYAKITLLDTRYLDPALIGEFVDFTNQDVLFIYGTTLLNNSGVMK
jgi:hypothetical protein